MTTIKRPSVFDLFGTDRDAEEHGRWFPIAEGMEFQIRRFKSKHTTNVRLALEKPYERLRKKNVLPEDIMEKVVHQTLCQSTIVNWRGEAMIDQEGNPIVFSAEAADALLTALPELRDVVTALSLDMDNFRKADDEEIEGN